MTTGSASASTSASSPEIGVIGGSGLYSLLPDAREVAVRTPYGDPSGPLMVTEVGGRGVAFLPRHGRDHEFPPHRINYRANLWALRSLGVRQVLAPCAVGSLRPDYGPGTLVIPDQLVDRTSGRVQTYFDQGAVHVPFADPYCAAGRETVLKTAAESGVSSVVGRGAMVVIEGPRFSTRAESRWYARNDWPIVNMTGLPEAALARELALCYTSIALVTDLDAGAEAGAGVTQADVFEAFARNMERLRHLLLAVIPRLPAERDCACSRAHDGLTLPFPLP
ncbi:5'-methylthioadenosine phosphorylase [Kitasatospora sp. MAP12-15]|uniref:S-methyl-5'-thioadenosine phosphorylase n=1 Tax=unclassified Kitasatospora TaxID=2633591 RepID=UPI0024757015|nr:S-methyl-5'-thioadenosine phosphorylase [Kitasatospora sp. MAP12-44]MDH6109385.1 5'-methylthioadenosine phosphorylase [Kitasatospora sp. MAP12-44]